jgi:CheY-like chemotaxis protein
MRKILLVEDDPVLQETYKLILSTQPYICDIAENGRVALEMCEHKTYDLILLDIMMPEMNGVEFLKQFSDEEYIKSKVIIMSNLSSGAEIEKAKVLGVQKILLKADTSPTQLISMIRYHFDK